MKVKGITETTQGSTRRVGRPGKAALRKQRRLPIIRWGDLIYRLLAPVHWLFPRSKGCEACQCRRRRWNSMRLQDILKELARSLKSRFNIPKNNQNNARK